MATAYYSHSDCENHLTPAGHPERMARLRAISEALAAADFGALLRRKAPLADDQAILRCHPASHLDRLKSASPDNGFVALDPDTHMSPGSLRAALRAVGGNIAAVEAVLTGDVGNAFVGCRPPGHHAERNVPMGFCLFGNIAIAAKHALDHHGLQRVAIIDFDVHHGNGTQNLVEGDARIFFASTHQMPLYPGTGFPAERGAHGNVLNVPLEPESGSAAMRAAYDRVVFQAVEAFQPELILVSAGFDAHRDDLLANLNWRTEDFAWVTGRICDLAEALCGGRVVSTLEGGYDLTALGQSVAAHVKVLMERGG